MSKTIVLGITGTISSGKSLVGKILEDKGVPVIDTDKVVHSLLQDDLKTKSAIFETFGPAVFAPMEGDCASTQPVPPLLSNANLSNFAVDRKALGLQVFNDSSLKAKLEAIVHPNVILRCRKLIQDLQNSLKDKPLPMVAVLVPLLFEAHLEKEYDQIWSVYTDEEIIRERLKRRDGLSDSEVEKRLRAQLPQEEKARRADQVIDNSKSKEETEHQVDVLLSKLQKSHRYGQEK
ncbi:MAG: dephospho-CoA kinase [Candidatus Obscuribacterales bacterium]|nr:dephospho-CoA kinase [Candidatus Obscuribacterales bacterium]